MRAVGNFGLAFEAYKELRWLGQRWEIAYTARVKERLSRPFIGVDDADSLMQSALVVSKTSTSRSRSAPARRASITL